MTGIFLIIVVGLWLWLCVSVARRLLLRLHARPWRWLVAPVIFVALLVAPLVDEIVGGYQFRSMCARDAVLKVDAEEVRGKLLKRSSLQSFPAGTLLPVERWAVWYVDPASNRELLRYNWLRVSGGLLIRTLGISQNNSPLTIDPSSCSPKLDGPLEAKYGFSLINN